MATETNMRFRQLDRILEINPGVNLRATLSLSGEEDYLKDHFPLFKVMPGVLMLEALFQASCWLIRASENFEHTLLVLKEARNVKFADFMEPGNQLEINVEFVKSDDKTVTIKASGTKGEGTAVSARLIIGKSRLADQDATLAGTDTFMKVTLKSELEKLTAN